MLAITSVNVKRFGYYGQMLGRNSGLNSGADAGYQIMVIAFKDLSKDRGFQVA